MTASQQAQIAEVERERRDREEEFKDLLLLLLLVTYGTTAKAIEDRRDPISAAIGVINGNGRQHKGLAWALTPLLRLAWLDGYQRTATLAGVRNAPVSRELLDAIHRPLAETTADDLAAKVSEVIRKSVTTGGTIAEQVARLKIDFGRAGYLAAVKPLDMPAATGTQPKPDVMHKPFAAQRLAQRLSYGAYNDGWWTGWQDGAGKAVAGFEHVSTIDERTSEICSARHTTKLPKDHPYWKTNWAPLHPWCRSIHFPIKTALWTPESDIPWSPPPTPGFGQAPRYVFR